MARANTYGPSVADINWTRQYADRVRTDATGFANATELKATSGMLLVDAVGIVP